MKKTGMVITNHNHNSFYSKKSIINNPTLSFLSPAKRKILPIDSKFNPKLWTLPIAYSYILLCIFLSAIFRFVWFFVHSALWLRFGHSAFWEYGNAPID
jgi:hypothetical protein